MSNASSISWLFTANAFFFSFQVLAYVCRFPSLKRFNMDAYFAENGRTLMKKMFILILSFRYHFQLYSRQLLYILNFHHKCLLFKFRSRGIRMHIPNQSKNVLLQLNFQGESHLCLICFFHILTIQRNSLLFQFLSGDIWLHIPVLIGVQTGWVSR